MVQSSCGHYAHWLHPAIQLSRPAKLLTPKFWKGSGYVRMSGAQWCFKQKMKDQFKSDFGAFVWKTSEITPSIKRKRTETPIFQYQHKSKKKIRGLVHLGTTKKKPPNKKKKTIQGPGPCRPGDLLLQVVLIHRLAQLFVLLAKALELRGLVVDLQGRQGRHLRTMGGKSWENPYENPLQMEHPL